MSGDYGFAGEKLGRGLTNNIHSHCTPSIDLDGDIEAKVKRALNVPGAFRGRIINAENIGKSSRAAPQAATLAGAAHLAGCTLHGSADVCKKGYFARAAKLP